MYLLNKGLDFPSVFVQVVSDTELSCPVEREKGKVVLALNQYLMLR